MIRFRKDPDPGNGNGSAARLAEAAAERDRLRARLLEIDEQLGTPPRLTRSPFDPEGRGERIAARHATARLAEERATVAAELEEAEAHVREAQRAQLEEDFGPAVKELRKRFADLGPEIERWTDEGAQLYARYQLACEDWTRLSGQLTRRKADIRVPPVEGPQLPTPQRITQTAFFGPLGRLAKRGMRDLQSARSAFKPFWRRSPNRIVLPEVRLPGYMQAPPNAMRR